MVRCERERHATNATNARMREFENKVIYSKVRVICYLLEINMCGKIVKLNLLKERFSLCVRTR